MSAALTICAPVAARNIPAQCSPALAAVVCVVARRFSASMAFARIARASRCTTSSGGPLDHTVVARTFKAALKRAGLSLLHVPHHLRHTFASKLLEARAPLPWLSRQLGHANPAITLKIYAHAMPSEDGDFADLLDQVTTSNQKRGVASANALSASDLQPTGTESHLSGV